MNIIATWTLADWADLATAISGFSVFVALLFAGWELALSRAEAKRGRAESELARKESRLARKMQIVELQANLRHRWIEWYDSTRAMDLESYPASGRKYTELERQIIREYWSIVVFNEFVLTNEFQKGHLADLWPYVNRV